jgi:hypothetical protein
MKRILCGGILLFAVSMFAQQVPYGSPPRTTPPTFPSDKSPRLPQSDQQPQYPPDVAPPQTERPSASSLETLIRERLAAEPLLKNAKLDVRVGSRDITVTGNVDDQRQHDMAMRIVQSNAGDRQVVDKMKVRS